MKYTSSAQDPSVLGQNTQLKLFCGQFESSFFFFNNVDGLTLILILIKFVAVLLVNSTVVHGVFEVL